MNEGFSNFVNSIGVLCEMWSLTYGKFVELGYDHATALSHTKEFMATLISTHLKNNGSEKET